MFIYLLKKIDWFAGRNRTFGAWLRRVDVRSVRSTQQDGVHITSYLALIKGGWVDWWGEKGM